MNTAGFILIAIGLFSLAGGLFNWGWFMQTRRARAMVRTMGPKWARAFYMLLGIVVIVFGILLVLGVIGGSK